MCGIAGILGGNANETSLTKMLNQQINRGPDGEGTYFSKNISLGMRRLSIIDLEHGWQPLYSRNKKVVAFQNGEIYNFKQLKYELISIGYTFKTTSDTEVLAHGYDAWGMEQLLDKLDGMYALAIFDIDKQELNIARDRFGEKPLFFGIRNGSFYYSSSIKSLVATGFEKKIDQNSLKQYLALHYIPGEKTIFTDIFRLLPGSFFKIKTNLENYCSSDINIKRYYSPKQSRLRHVSSADIFDLVKSTIESRLVSDVPIGVFLSGGIDSSLITYFAKKLNPDIQTFSIGFEGYVGDESEDAKLVAGFLKTDHKTFNFDSKSFSKILPLVASSLDEPIGDQATLPMYWLCSEASKDVKVVLSGEGGDELFAGYNYYEKFSIPNDFNKRLKWLLINYDNINPDLIGEHETASGFPIVCGEHDINNIVIDDSHSIKSAWDEYAAMNVINSFDPLQRATFFDLIGWLPDNLLIKLDRIGMAHSLEGRAPFLSKNLVDTALNLYPSQKFCGGISKIALRKIADKILPKEIAYKRKQGFVLPMKGWLKDWFSMFGNANNYFENRKIPNINYTYLNAMIQEQLDLEITRERFVFSIVMLHEWYFYS